MRSTLSSVMAAAFLLATGGTLHAETPKRNRRSSIGRSA
jgi:hypothetical protein